MGCESPWAVPTVYLAGPACVCGPQSRTGLVILYSHLILSVYREEPHQSRQVGPVLEHSGWQGGAVDTVVAPDHIALLLHLQAGAGGEEDGAGLLLHPPDLLPGPGVDGPQTGGRDDGVARHGDDTLLHGGDVVTVPLTPPVLQSETQISSSHGRWKRFNFFYQKAKINVAQTTVNGLTKNKFPVAKRS